MEWKKKHDVTQPSLFSTDEPATKTSNSKPVENPSGDETTTEKGLTKQEIDELYERDEKRWWD